MDLLKPHRDILNQWKSTKKILIIRGEQGVGKSTLVRAIRREVVGNDLNFIGPQTLTNFVVTLQCEPPLIVFDNMSRAPFDIIAAICRCVDGKELLIRAPGTREFTEVPCKSLFIWTSSGEPPEEFLKRSVTIYLTLNEHRLSESDLKEFYE